MNEKSHVHLSLEQLRGIPEEHIYGLVLGFSQQEITTVQEELSALVPKQMNANISEKLKAEAFKIAFKRKMKDTLDALSVGFTRVDIRADWFSNDHVSICYGKLLSFDGQRAKPIPVEQLRGLSRDQALALVSSSSTSSAHVEPKRPVILSKAKTQEENKRELARDLQKEESVQSHLVFHFL
jgi:hypothetical protein